MTDRLRHDIRFALRGLRRTPAFTLSATLILTISIGMAAAMATIFDAVLLRRLPVQQQERIATFWLEKDAGVELPLDYDDLTQLRRDSRTMRDIGGYAHWGAFAFPLADGDRPVVIPQSRVTGNFFDVLGVRPALGRLLRPEDDLVGAPKVIVLGYDAWLRQFHGDSSVIGRRLRVPTMDYTYTVVGVAPAGLDFPIGTGYWITVRSLGGAGIDFVARLAPGATVEAAGAEALALMRHAHPDYRLSRVNAKSFQRAVVGDVRPILAVLTAAVALLLLIACVNVGNLLLLRAGARARELTIRRALGASARDIARQLLVESTALGLAGGALGLLCAIGLLRLLLALAPTQLPRTDVIQLAGAPVGIAITVTMFAVLLFGLLPALMAARESGGLAASLRSDVRSGQESASRRRVRQWLVAAQLALALLTLAGAGLLVRSLEKLERMNLGYRADHLVLVEMSFPFSRFETRPRYMALFDRVYTRLRQVPEVSALTPVLIPPFLGPNVWQWQYQTEGQSKEEAEKTPLVPVEAGGEEYFRTFGIPLLRGRGFEITDRDSAPKVVVVSEAIANRTWPGKDPIGKRIRFTSFDSTEWRTVVGVAGDIRFRSLRDATPTIYLPWRQSENQAYFAVRTNATISRLLPAMRLAAHEVDPGVDFWRARTMDELLGGPLAQPRLSTLLLSSFSVVALLLAAIGLYGVMASSVREQTRELGIRMALGATPELLRRTILVRALRVTLAGAVVGLAAALASSRLLGALLYQVSPTDPATLGGVCALLIAVALAAAYLPARRATRIDPARALRE